MKKCRILIVIVITFIFGSIIGISLIAQGPITITEQIKHKLNNSTRNISYEHYCDSIWITNPDYYLDVLVETDEFQDYIEKHGQWWDN
jgi:hypothetical protein